MAAASSNKFTVVLMRPDYMTSDFGQDCYVAHVEAVSEYAAVDAGQHEAAEADHKEGEEGLRDIWEGALPNHEDYYPLLVFEGHHNVKLFGFQL